jgi:H(+)-translocating pyrophosphatase
MTQTPLVLAQTLMGLPYPYFLAPAAGIAALIMAAVFAASVRSKSEGDDEQIRIAKAVREGAMAYLRRQYKVVAMVFVALIAVLFIMSYGLGLQPSLSLIGVPVAGLLSGLCGWLGMRMATAASARTAAAAKNSLNDGLTVAFRAGAVMGLNVVGFAILDISFWFWFLTSFGERLGITHGDGAHQMVELSTIVLSFAMGASTQALFARVGGGIYTKAADVGADLVGKVEAGIPEDDPRNPATIADNVGDNVGDVAGMGADLYESYYGSILSAIALGATAAIGMTALDSAGQSLLAMKIVVTPLALAGLGILCSILGIFIVRTQEGANFAQLLAALGRGVWFASALIALGSLGLLFFLFRTTPEVSWLGLWGSIVSGLLAGLLIAKGTEYYTSYEHPPTRRIALQALTGPATVIIAGIAEGMKSTWTALLTVVIGILAAYICAGGQENFLMGLYGVSIAAVGMLSTLGITLATDAYGPIADNAGGNAEMSGQPPHVRERTDMLDSLGNTTAATGKGFAIGSAALTALALFAAYIGIVQTQITNQARSFVANHTYSTQSPKPAAEHAIYMGNNLFASVVPGVGKDGKDHVDALMLVDRSQLPADGAFQEMVRPGNIFILGAAETSERVNAADGDLFRLSGSRELTVSTIIPHGTHDHAVAIDVVAASRGTIADVLSYYDVTLTNPRVIGGLFLGTLLTFLFCALTMSAVGRAAYSMMGECRRQFGIMRQALRGQGMTEDQIADPQQWPKQIKDAGGKEYPDYATCVSIATAGAQKEMVIPSLLAISVPIGVGLVLSVPGVIGLLAGGLTSGFAVAIFMANAGGAWDNAKKLIESYGRITAEKFLNDAATADRVPIELHETLRARAQEMVRVGKGGGYIYGKGSDDHKAAVVGDTVGDPFKDTSGPSLNILIKLISVVSVVFAGLTVKYGAVIGTWLGLN